MAAAANNHTEVVKVLAAHRADLEAKNLVSVAFLMPSWLSSFCRFTAFCPAFHTILIILLLCGAGAELWLCG